MYLSMFVRRYDDHILVDVAGDVDINSAPWLERRLLTLLVENGTRLLVDLSGVTFIDCFAIRLLTGTCWQADQRACFIEFVALSEMVQRLTELTGLTGELALAGRPAARPVVRA
jgi:anti-sigma B factor antagonist